MGSPDAQLGGPALNPQLGGVSLGKGCSVRGTQQLTHLTQKMTWPVKELVVPPSPLGSLRPADC